MVKVFSCNKCGPSIKSISHIQFSNDSNPDIMRLVQFKKDQLIIKFSTDHIDTDDEYIEEFICSKCGAPSVISFMPEFLFSMGVIKDNISK